MGNVFGVILIIVGLLVLVLPDPTSITDFIALAIILSGLQLSGANLDKVFKSVKKVF